MNIWMRSWWHRLTPIAFRMKCRRCGRTGQVHLAGTGLGAACWRFKYR